MDRSHIWFCHQAEGKQPQSRQRGASEHYMSAQPEVGSWYRTGSGTTFEVVAIDEDDGTVEVQYFDGTVEELDLEDWEAQSANGEIEAAEAPEDWTGSVDVESDDAAPTPNSGYESDQRMASGLDGLDLFESPDALS